MDTDKIKVFGSKVRVDSTAKVAELELAEKVCASNNLHCCVDCSLNPAHMLQGKYGLVRGGP